MAVETGSYIYNKGTAPNTRAASSMKNKVFGYAVGKGSYVQMGVISEFSHDESRSADPIKGIGYGDIIAELVPGYTEPMSLSLNKTLLYTANIFQLVGYKGGIDGLVRSLRHHRWPFDLKQELVHSEISSQEQSDGAGIKNSSDEGVHTNADRLSASLKATFTYYEGCWFNSYNASYSSDQAMVSETSSVTVTDVVDGTSQYGEYIDSGLAPIASNGGGGHGYSRRFALSEKQT